MARRHLVRPYGSDSRPQGGLLRLLGIVLALLVLTTCTSDAPLGPPLPVGGSLDLTAFLRSGGGNVPIPIDTVFIELRHHSDSSVAFSSLIPASQFQQSNDSLIVPITVDLRAVSEQFYLYAEARGTGIVYYTVQSVVTIVAGQTARTNPLQPTYIGPGAGADSVVLSPAAATLQGGDSLLLSAVVYQAGLPVAGAPVGFLSSDTTKVARPRALGINQAYVFAPPALDDTLRIIAVTPSGLADTGQLVITSIVPPPASGFDAALDFSATSNPNGVWSSGWTPTLGGSFTLFTTPGVSGSLDQWLDPAIQVLTTPTFEKNVGATVAFGTNPGQVALHTGCNNNEFAVLRWTAPATGGFLLASQFFAGDVGNTDISVLRNGNVTSPLFTAASTSSNPSFSLFSTFTAGETLDFVVGAGGDGCTSDTSPLDVLILTGTPSVSPSAGTGQSAQVGTPVPVAPAVAVRDAGGAPVQGVTVAFAMQSGGGTLTGATALTDAAGHAAVGSWTLGPAVGGNSLTATVNGLTPVTFSATGTAATATQLVKISGDGQSANNGTALPQPLVVEAEDGSGNPVQGVTVAWTASDGGITASSVTGSNGRAQASWTLGSTQLTPTATATVTGLPPVSFSATTVFPTPIILLDIPGNDLVGVGFSTTVNITLSTPAPAGGAAVTVTSDNSALVSIPPPGTVLIPQGTSTGQIVIDGVAAGSTTIRANAATYLEGTLNVQATLQIIGLPATLNVPFGGTASIPVTLAQPAPSPTTVTLNSSNPSFVGIVTTTVTIPQGQQSANGTVSGVSPGPATVTASAAGYVPGSSAMTTTASLNITTASTVINASFGTTLTVQLESGGLPIAAPAPGVSVSFSSADPTCVAVTTPRTIATGVVNTTFTVTYGGTAALPCNTTVTASAPNIVSDVVTVTVNPQPTITLFGVASGTNRIGTDLEDAASGQLQVANPGPGGITVHLVSSDPAVALLAPDAATAGQPFVDLIVPVNQSGFNYVVHGITQGAFTITASATGFSNGTVAPSVVQPAVDLIGLVASTTSLSANDLFQARIGASNAPGNGVAVEQPIRVGGAPVIATLNNSTSPTAQLVTTAATAQQVTVALGVGQSRSATTVATGGVEFDPLGAGSTTVSVTIPGYLSGTTASQIVTVSAPTITLFAVASGTNRIGADLSDAASGQLQVPNPGPLPLTVHLVSSDPAVALLAPDAVTAGQPFIDLSVPSGGSGFNYQVLGLAQGPFTITASAPAYTNATVAPTVVQPAMDIIGLVANTTALSANDLFQVRIGAVTAAGTSVNVEQAIRVGGTPVTATLTNSTSAVAQLVTTAVTGDTVTVALGVGQSRSPVSVATGGVEFDPLGAGTTSVIANIPGYAPIPADTQTVTVTAPAITLFTVAQGTGRIGTDLVDAGSGNLGTPNPGPGNLTVHLVSSNPAVALLAPDAATPGQPFIDLSVPVNGSGFNYVVYGVTQGAVTITASAPGYTNATTGPSIVQPALDIIGLITSTTSLSTNDLFQIRIGAVNAAGNAVAAEQSVRLGAAAVTATINNSSSSAAQLVTTPLTAQQVTVALVAGQSRSPASVATGGVEFDPLGAGSTTVSATIPGYVAGNGASQVVTITAPPITLFTPAQGTGRIGADLVDGASGSLGTPNPGPGSLTIHLVSSNPSVALLAPDVTTPGQPFIDLAVPANGSGFNYVVQGLPAGVGNTVQITASANGYLDGTATVSIVQPALDVIGVTTTTTTLSTNDAFQVRIGAVNLAGNAVAAEQAIRLGGAAVTSTVTNSNSAAAQLVTTATTGQSVTTTLVVGQSRSPGTVATGGMEFDPVGAGSTNVVGSISGFVATAGATQTVVVSAPLISLFTPGQGTGLIGNGLQDAASGSLQVANPGPGALTVHLVSSNPAAALLAPDASSPGQPTLDVSIPANGSTITYEVQGMGTGTVSITASAPGYTNGTTAATVVQPAFDIVALTTPVSSTAPNDAFQIRLGAPNSTFNFINVEQGIRFGGATVTVTINNSSSAAAQLVTTATTGQQVTVTISAGQARSDPAVAGGGVEFDPLAPGATTVSATIPGFFTLPTAAVPVTVQ